MRDYVFPMFRANTVYEGQYLLGTSIARPLIAKKQIEIARKVGADAVSHGATGKGNDQVRFEIGYYALEPDIRVIAPWREWDFKSREATPGLRRAAPDPDRQGQARRRPLQRRREPPALLQRGQGAGRPGRGGPGVRAPAHHRSRRTLPIRRTVFTHGLRARRPRGHRRRGALSPAALLTKLNQLGHDNGVGRLDLVENRFVGMKSRGVYETPGGTILLAAHRGIESRSRSTGAPCT